MVNNIPDFKLMDKELKAKLSEMFEKLDSLPMSVDIQEKFDLFRSYFRGIDDGWQIGLHSVNIKIENLPPGYVGPSITVKVDKIINDFETGEIGHKDAWDQMWNELHSSY